MGFAQPGRRTEFTGHALQVVEARWLHRRDHRLYIDLVTRLCAVVAVVMRGIPSSAILQCFLAWLLSSVVPNSVDRGNLRSWRLPSFQHGNQALETGTGTRRRWVSSLEFASRRIPSSEKHGPLPVAPSRREYRSDVRNCSTTTPGPGEPSEKPRGCDM